MKRISMNKSDLSMSANNFAKLLRKIADKVEKYPKYTVDFRNIEVWNKKLSIPLMLDGKSVIRLNFGKEDAE